MISLEDYGFRNIKNIYLCEFITGHGGDYFITLYSVCHRDFLRFLDSKEDLETRFNHHLNTDTKLRMPGNNIGKKLIFIRDDIESHIIDDLKKLLIRRPEYVDAKFLNMATHPIKMVDDRSGTRQHTDIKSATYIYSFFESKYEYKNIILVPTTFESFAFIAYFMYSEGEPDTTIIRDIPYALYVHTDVGDSVINSDEFKGDVVYIDHMDIALNCEGKFLPLSKKLINDNYDDDMFEMTLDFYRKQKLEKFLEWLKTTPLREQLEQIYNDNKQDHKFTVINSKNIDEFLK
jgi:hypothetical protein